MPEHTGPGKCHRAERAIAANQQVEARSLHADLIDVSSLDVEPRGGKKTPEREAFEKSAAIKKGQRFRAGIEGRISVLARGRGMKRCVAEGSERFELWVGAAVLANNLMAIAS